MRNVPLALAVLSFVGCANHTESVAAPGAPVAAPITTVEVEATAPVARQEPMPVAIVDQPPPPPRAAASDDRLETSAPRHRAKVLDGQARPSKITPGSYMCRVDAMYKLRPCTVTRDEKGFSWLTTPGSLLELKGVLYDDGNAVIFEGATGEPRPFGCFSCDERCTDDPTSCVCQELMPDASRECLAQPLKVRLTRKGQGWSGTLAYKTYFNHYEGKGADRHVTGWDPSPNTFVVEIMPGARTTKPPPSIVAPQTAPP